jgi:hypothetical protein
VFLSVSFPRLLGVVPGMVGVTARGVSVVCRFLVVPTIVMLGRLPVMAGSMCMML